MDAQIKIYQSPENTLNQIDPLVQILTEDQKTVSTHDEESKNVEKSSEDDLSSKKHKNHEDDTNETEEIASLQVQKDFKVDENVVILIRDLISDRNEIVCLKITNFYSQVKPDYQSLIQTLVVLLDRDQLIRKIFFENLRDIFEANLSNKLPGVFNRIILKYLDKLNPKTELDLQKYQKDQIHVLWSRFDVASIPDFIRIFDLQTLIPYEQLHKYLIKMVESKKIPPVMNLFKLFKFSDSQIIKIIDATYKSNPSAAAEIVLRCKFPIKDFSRIDIILKIVYVKYMFKIQTWYNCEESMAALSEEFLINLVQILYSRNQKNEALSIVVRHKIQNKIKDQSINKKINDHLNLNNFQYLDNILVTEDDFVPTQWIINKQENKEDYLTILELGVTEQQTFFISDDQSELYKNVDTKLRNSLVTGIDSEFLCSTSKFDQNGTLLKTVQISNGQENYVFDLVTLKKSVLFKELMKYYLETISILKVGLSVLGDIQLLCSTLELKKITVQNVIDVGKVYQNIHNEPRQKGLAFLTEFYLKKKLSKLDQCSNWSNRPLRRAQLHYAALDALVCVRIYEKQLLDDNIDKVLLEVTKSYSI